jgi:hypothetical protein
MQVHSAQDEGKIARELFFIEKQVAEPCDQQYDIQIIRGSSTAAPTIPSTVSTASWHWPTDADASVSHY